MEDKRIAIKVIKDTKNHKPTPKYISTYGCIFEETPNTSVK
jgi:hypothetical protein